MLTFANYRLLFVGKSPSLQNCRGQDVAVNPSSIVQHGSLEKGPRSVYKVPSFCKVSKAFWILKLFFSTHFKTWFLPFFNLPTSNIFSKVVAPDLAVNPQSLIQWDFPVSFWRLRWYRTEKRWENADYGIEWDFMGCCPQSKPFTS